MSSPQSELLQQHLSSVRAFYDDPTHPCTAAGKSYRRLLAHYYNLLILPGASVLEIGCGGGELMALLHAGKKVGVDLSSMQVELARRHVGDGIFFVQAGEELSVPGTFDYIIISDTLNFAGDVQQLFMRLHENCHADTRLLLNFQSSVWRPILSLATHLGLKARQPQSSWLASSDVMNLLELSDWQLIQHQARLLLPINIPVVSRVINRWLAPIFSWACLTFFIVARPSFQRGKVSKDLTVSVVIPARNEEGNIAAAVRRTPIMGAATELIFVEGHSRDATWAAIQQVAKEFPELAIKILQQTGKGKGNAVREGFAVATGDILMILDADLTMPPEELPKFYRILAENRAEFANGVRLVYPMDKKAMQFLNLCANKAFGLIFTWLLGQPVKDTLCGTKVLLRSHYLRIAENRSYFGDFDPFGDFDLLFGASKLGLKIADVPIRYRERTYGTTNIQRWSHGWLLLRMIAFAARKLKFV